MYLVLSSACVRKRSSPLEKESAKKSREGTVSDQPASTADTQAVDATASVFDHYRSINAILRNAFMSRRSPASSTACDAVRSGQETQTAIQNSSDRSLRDRSKITIPRS